MIDHLLGRPNTTWKRSQVFLVLAFWLTVLVRGNEGGPRFFWIRRINRFLHGRFSPWQIIVGVMTVLYAAKHFDSIVGLASPEPLARLYSKSYYRATWLVTALDAGFATAMNVRPKWLRDITSVVLAGYYIFYANEADEKLRKFRAVATVEMLRTTWEKTTNPYLRALSYLDRPRINIVRQMTLPRPPTSSHKRPIRAWLFFNGTEFELSQMRDLVLDFPGGGFICMSPQHHEERLRRWAIRSRRPILSIDYGKAPEYPYPWAIEEGFDVYQTLLNDKGRMLGMSGDALNMILAGDSAGANIVATIIYKALESPVPLPLPLAIIFNYAALDFSFSAWMSPAHLRVLRTEQSSGHIPGLEEQKNHLDHRSPLSVVKDVRAHRRRKSWRESISGKLPFRSPPPGTAQLKGGKVPNALQLTQTAPVRRGVVDVESEGHVADTEEENEDSAMNEADKPLHARIKTTEGLKDNEVQRAEKRKAARSKVPIGTRLTMTSRTGFFQDRIISPSMMRAMAILYIGSRHNPDFDTDYYISPILAPSSLLEKFPPLLMTCGEKDPFVDDTVIFAGRIREAKRARKVALQTAGLGRGGFYGESLRMTSSAAPGYGDGVNADKEILQEREEDWVQMHIYEGWSHAYMMMTTVMPGARAAINQNADWIRMMFERNEAKRPPAPARWGASSMNAKGEADLGLPITSEESSEEMLEFASSKKRRMSSMSSSRTPMPSLQNRNSSSAGSRLASSDDTNFTGPVTPPNVPRTHSDAPPVTVRLRSPQGKRSASHSSADRQPASNKRVSDLHSPPATDPRSGTPSLVLNEAELMRRRRAEAVFGIGESQAPSDIEDEDSPIAYYSSSRDTL